VLHLLMVCFLAKMKMRCKGVLEEMDKEKPNKNQEQRLFAGEVHGLRDHFDKSDGQHITRAESQEILQVAAGPFAIDNEISAQQIANGCN